MCWTLVWCRRIFCKVLDARLDGSKVLPGAMLVVNVKPPQRPLCIYLIENIVENISCWLIFYWLLSLTFSVINIFIMFTKIKTKMSAWMQLKNQTNCMDLFFLMKLLSYVCLFTTLLEYAILCWTLLYAKTERKTEWSKVTSSVN